LAQFDVHRLAGGSGLVVDCQSNLLNHLDSRFVVPLVPKANAPKPGRRFNPVFAVEGIDHVLLTQFSGAVDRRQLGKAIASLADHSFEITDALDVLISGV
jgi:toxin CcdB